MLEDHRPLHPPRWASISVRLLDHNGLGAGNDKLMAFRQIQIHDAKNRFSLPASVPCSAQALDAVETSKFALNGHLWPPW